MNNQIENKIVTKTTTLQPGMTLVQIGDIILNDGKKWVCDFSSEARCRLVLLLPGPCRVVQMGKKREVEFADWDKSISIAQPISAEMVAERGGEQFLKAFLANKRGSSSGQANNKTTGAGENENMAEIKARGGLAAEALAAKAGNKTKAKKAAKVAKQQKKEPVITESCLESAAVGEDTKTPTPSSEPVIESETTTRGSGGKRMNKIMGSSVCSVVRALGAAGVTAPQATAILAANGIIDMSPGSMSVQLGFGRNGKLKCADLTAEQLQTIMASAPK